MTREVAVGVEALDHAWRQGQPELFTTDPGAQFPSRACTARLQTGAIHLLMDGRGWALDNVLGERWCRTVKAEEVDLRDDQRVRDARQG
jgi:putative transposase